MSGELTYELLEESSLWPKVAGVAGAVAVMSLALWFVPGALKGYFAPTHAPQKITVVDAQPISSKETVAPDNIRVISIDAAPTTTTTTPSTPTDRIATAATTEADPTTSPTIDASQSTPTTTAPSTQSTLVNAMPWGPLASAQTAGFDADPAPIVRPPLPRAKPRLTALGTLWIPLPHPRPPIATDEPAAQPEVLVPDRLGIN
jgi:hypothetical protein